MISDRRFVLPLLAALAITSTSYGQLSSTVAQSGANDRAPGPLVNTNGASGTNDSIPITGTTDVTDVTNPALNPFTFDAGEVAALSSIDNIQITLTIFNGDSGTGEFDFDNLTLGLDGFDTGIKLNGFDSASGDDVTQTIFSISITNSAQILTALQADNMLTATIIDATGNPDSNAMELPSAFNTTLVINIPEPTTTSLLVIAAATALFALWKRRGRAGSARSAILLALTAGAAILFSSQAQAANPTGAPIATTGPTLNYVGTADGDPPGVQVINPNPLSGEDQDQNLTEGDNVDTYTLTVQGTEADWATAKKVVNITITWTVPANDYDLLVRKGTVTGPIVESSGNFGVPEETVTIDPAVAGVGDYKIRTVYFNTPTVQASGADQYQATVTVVDKEQTPGGDTLRSANYIKGGITFSPSHTMAAPFTFRDGEPSSRVDKFGNYYICGIRGVPAGVDLWYFDLRPTIPGEPTKPVGKGVRRAKRGGSTGGFVADVPNPNYDPFMRNPIYRGQPDSFTQQEQFFSLGADGGGDIDVALGRDNFNATTPPFIATTSLTAANLSAQRSTDKGVSFSDNPLGNVPGGVPVDDRQWMESEGSQNVYLYYRTISAVLQHIVQKSTDGGMSYGQGIEVNVPPSQDDGQTGSIAVDQNDGTVYASRAKGTTGIIVGVGTPDALLGYPLTYTNTTVVDNFPGETRHLFVPLKVAANGWVYVCWSNGASIWLTHSKNKGATWAEPVRVSDGDETKSSLFPWLETGDVPGAVSLTWYGTDSPTNSDSADWHVYFAQTFNADDTQPTFRQVRASDHVIHAANISEGGLTGSLNRNLIDYFQQVHDPQGAAVIGFTDDHNDFSGNLYVARQITGPSINGSEHHPLGPQVEGSGLPPAPAALKNVVTDFTPDARQGGTPETGGPISIPTPDPVDIVSVTYIRTDTISGPALTATMKVSDLTQPIPAGCFWRMLFAVNVPNAVMSPTGEFTLGTVDRGDLFYLAAVTDATGRKSYEYGTQTRLPSGALQYDKVGNADRGSFNQQNGEITVRVSVDKINAILTQRGKPLIATGSIIAGLRGYVQQNLVGENLNKSDITRGGGQFPFSVRP